MRDSVRGVASAVRRSIERVRHGASERSRKTDTRGRSPAHGPRADIGARRRSGTRAGAKILARSSKVAKIGVWEGELPSNTLRWSDGVYDIFELSRGSVVTREQTLESYPPESLVELEPLRSGANREGVSFTLDARTRTATGARRWMRITASVEREGCGP